MSQSIVYGEACVPYTPHCQWALPGRKFTRDRAEAERAARLIDREIQVLRAKSAQRN